VAALRTAFDRMVKHPAFIDEITKAGFQLSPATGVEVQSAVAQATKLDASLTKMVRDMAAKPKSK
jgi:hypothetical protein